MFTNLFRPKLGTKKRPIIVHVQNERRAGEIASICKQHGWQFIAGIEADKPENIADLEKALRSPFAQHTKPDIQPKVGKNDYCPCGSNSVFCYKHEFDKQCRLRQKECPITVIIIESDKP